MNIKKCTKALGRALHQCQKAHCGKLAFAIRKKRTVRMRLHVTCARKKHSYEIGMCDKEYVLHAYALNKGNVCI